MVMLAKTIGWLLIARLMIMGMRLSVASADIVDIVDDLMLDSALSRNKHFVLLSYVTQCPYSRMFMPIFENVCKMAGLECGKLNCQEQRILCHDTKVEGVPDVKVYTNKEIVYHRAGFMSQDDFLAEIRKLNLNRFRLITSR
ncbi:uncharacterized protein LOC135922503 [Gordionus sp. m RMFG-2023]|uniref:uncharacterized protein LOC135922503 n=1 Tax=Gordionus sp. m RMFG-2023 TaxID=3053472 RepID=UPI0031FCCB1C